jgi:tetratricopeptide (TPR) repeat protein
MNDARRLVDKYELLFKNATDMETILFLGLKAKLKIFLNEYDEAEKCLGQAGKIYRKYDVALHIYAEPYIWSRFVLDVRRLEESIVNKNESGVKQYGKQTRKSSKTLLQNANKYASRRSNALSLIARYHWLIGKQNKAVKCWKKAINEGERLGQSPDLARTYMEVGKRFLEENSKNKELNGINAKEYLEKARTMFKEMDLQWDLDELDKIAADV